MTEPSEAGRELRGVVAVGASAGGVDALTRFSGGLLPGLPYAVLVTLHIPASAPSVLARIVDRAGACTSTPAVHGERVEAGRIYVAVPNHHLLLDGDRLVLSQGPSENGHRPAINALFRSVALSWGRRAVGILMSGVLDDGVVGLAAIRARGGTTIVQNPSDAQFPDMPCHALETDVVDTTAPAGELGRVLTELAQREFGDEGLVESDGRMELENRIAGGGHFSTSFESELLGPPSGYTCPDCGGTLVGVDERNYRCRVGHAWTAEALLSSRDKDVERAVWMALRSLEEKASLSRRLALRLGPGHRSERHAAAAAESERAIEVLAGHFSHTLPPPGGHHDE